MNQRDPIAQLVVHHAFVTGSRDGNAWAHTRDSIISALANWRVARHAFPFASARRGRLGLTYEFDGLFLDTLFGGLTATLPRPFGWRWTPVLGHDAYHLMPIWLYIVARKVPLWRWTVYRGVARVGLLQSPMEGDLWTDHHFTLRVWRSWYIKRRWPRFAQWCQGKEEDFLATYPRWQ